MQENIFYLALNYFVHTNFLFSNLIIYLGQGQHFILFGTAPSHPLSLPPYT